MANNPNLVKLGEKRSLSQKLPQWLFPTKSGSNLNTIIGENDVPKGKKAKQMAKDLLKRRAAGEVSTLQLPSLLLDSIESYLDQIGFSKSSKAFKAEREGRAQTRGSGETPSLIVIFNEWHEAETSKTNQGQNDKKNLDKVKVLNYSKEQKNHLPDSERKISEESGGTRNLQKDDVETIDAIKDRDTSTSSSDCTSSSLSSSDSDTDTDDEKELVSHKTVDLANSKTNPKKRKAPTSSKSSSDSDSSSLKSAPKAKKAKKSAKASGSSIKSISKSNNEVNNKIRSTSSSESLSSSSSSSESSSSQSSESSSESKPEIELPEARKKKKSKSSKNNPSSDSSSKTLSSSNSEKTTGPSSGSDSDSSESSSPSSATADKKTTTTVSSSKKIPRAIKKKSDLITSTKPSTSKVTPTQIESTNTKKFSSKINSLPTNKSNEPFSRIPRNIKVDERLASNAYVPYDYAQKAHEDLIVTKGRGFTKEKNKKKRGSYRGGHIDVQGKNSVKFED